MRFHNGQGVERIFINCEEKMSKECDRMSNAEFWRERKRD